MSRYYRIEIGGDTPAVYTSYVNGVLDPGALMVEIDVAVYPMATPAGNSFVRVWGVSLETISQARDFNNAPITVYAGMGAGLPLSKPEQQGVIAQGIIIQAFGNWIGTNQTLDLILAADGGATQAKPANITFNMLKGQNMATAISSTLATAYPGYELTVNIDPKLVLSATETAFFQTIEQFAGYIKNLSYSILAGTTNSAQYSGVEILVQEKSIKVYDGSSQTAPIKLDFVDLIGQPTWIAPGQIQFNTVMRADIGVGSFVKFPEGAIVTTTAPSLSQSRDKSAFQGVFSIQFARHVGNSRQPDAQSWISTFNCFPVSS